MTPDNSVPAIEEKATTQVSPLPDPWLFYGGLLLLAMGLLMVTSASMPQAGDRLDQPFYYLIRQGIYIGLGLVGAAVVYLIPLDIWRKAGPALLLLGIGLLVLVLIPGVGKEVNGSMRWIPMGLMNVQVSELAKLFVIIYMAGYLQRHEATLQTSMMAMLRPMLVVGIIAILLLLEPDFDYRRAGGDRSVDDVSGGCQFLAVYCPAKRHGIGYGGVIVFISLSPCPLDQFSGSLG
jgi:cell division protein FtsW